MFSSRDRKMQWAYSRLLPELLMTGLDVDEDESSTGKMVLKPTLDDNEEWMIFSKERKTDLLHLTGVGVRGAGVIGAGSVGGGAALGGGIL